MAGTLYLVGTPIGNLGDFSPRGVETLQQVDFIAAEDTRVTRKLLSYFEIKKPLVSYFAHNRRESGERIIERLLGDESCALVSDAGMPGISDPGEELVALCALHGVEVICIPGPSAFVTALSLSGLPTGRFTFEGFLSTSTKSRRAHLAALKNEVRTMVFYEAPHKLSNTLRDMHEAWGDRRIALCRELTKRFEETIRTTLSEAVVRYETEKPRGEFVLIIEGAPASDAQEETVSLEDALSRVRGLTEAGESVGSAARRVAAETGFSKNLLYAEVVKQG